MLRVPAIITAVKSMARANGLRLQIDTQELTAEDEAEVMRLRDQVGSFVFAPAEQLIREEDIPELKTHPDEKSPSVRLRAAMWVLHEKRGGKPEEFDAYYKQYMERLIAKVKDTIHEIDGF